MLDLNLIRENPEKVKEALLKRMDQVDFAELLQWDGYRRASVVEVENLKSKRNSVSVETSILKNKGTEVAH